MQKPTDTVKLDNLSNLSLEITFLGIKVSPQIEKRYYKCARNKNVKQNHISK